MTLEQVLKWETRLGVRRTTVLMVTLWMTWRAFEWAAQYAGGPGHGMEAAAIIAAVTAPISYLQKTVFEAYIAAKGGSDVG